MDVAALPLRVHLPTDELVIRCKGADAHAVVALGRAHVSGGALDSIMTALADAPTPVRVAAVADFADRLNRWAFELRISASRHHSEKQAA